MTAAFNHKNQLYLKMKSLCFEFQAHPQRSRMHPRRRMIGSCFWGSHRHLDWEGSEESLRKPDQDAMARGAGAEAVKATRPGENRQMRLESRYTDPGEGGRTEALQPSKTGTSSQKSDAVEARTCCACGGVRRPRKDSSGWGHSGGGGERCGRSHILDLDAESPVIRA